MDPESTMCGQESLGDNIYAAEKLIDRRKRNRKVEYLVKWKDWGSEFSSWEPAVNILDHRLIEEFERNQVKIKPPSSESTLILKGKSFRKTPARASANSQQQSLETNLSMTDNKNSEPIKHSSTKFRHDNQLEKNKNKEKIIEYYNRNQYESESESDSPLDDPISKSSLDDDNYSTSSYSPSSQDNDSDNRFNRDTFNNKANKYFNKTDLNSLKITIKSDNNHKTNQKLKIKFHSDEEMTSSSNNDQLEEMEDKFANSISIFTPEFLKDRIQFANQVLITQIKDKNTVITFKESLSCKGFPKL